jgi:hypothetical protein
MDCDPTNQVSAFTAQFNIEFEMLALFGQLACNDIWEL